MISYPAGSQPHVNWKHIDGPLLTCRDGTPHWLTFRERLSLWLGLTNIYAIERRLLSSTNTKE